MSKGKDKVKLVIFDGTDIKVITGGSSTTMAGIFLTMSINVGNPFLAFSSLPQSGVPIAVDFDANLDWAGHGNVATSNSADNKEMVEEMLATADLAADTLTYAP